MTARTAEAHRGARLADGLAASLMLIGLAAAILMGALSDGFYHDDDVQHYVFARDAWANREALLHWWGRPGYNLPATLVARFFGMRGCRVFSAIQTALVAWLAYRIARRLLGPTPAAALAPALVWLQPLAMLLAETTLTETPAGLYLTAGMWLLLRGNAVTGCAVLSVTFVTRYETMGLAPLFVLFLLVDAWQAGGRRMAGMLKTHWLWAAAVALCWAPVAYGLAAWAAGLPRGSSPLYMFARGYTGEYGQGAAYHFIMCWAAAAGGGILALAVGGMVALGRRAWKVTAVCLGLLAIHTIIFVRGSFASGGYPRFLVPLAGMTAVRAAGGISALWRAKRWSVAAAVPAAAAGCVLLVWWTWGKGEDYATTAAAGAVGIAAVGIALGRAGRWRQVVGRCTLWIMILLVLLQDAVELGPLHLQRDPVWQAVTACLKATRGPAYAGRPALTSHVLVQHLRPETTKALSIDEAILQWRRAAPGTLFYWESKYSYAAHRRKISDELWRELWRHGNILFQTWNPGAAAVVFERRADR